MTRRSRASRCAPASRDQRAGTTSGWRRAEVDEAVRLGLLDARSAPTRRSKIWLCCVLSSRSRPAAGPRSGGPCRSRPWRCRTVWASEKKPSRNAMSDRAQDEADAAGAAAGAQVHAVRAAAATARTCWRAAAGRRPSAATCRCAAPAADGPSGRPRRPSVAHAKPIRGGAVPRSRSSGSAGSAGRRPVQGSAPRARGARAAGDRSSAGGSPGGGSSDPPVGLRWRLRSGAPPPRGRGSCGEPLGGPQPGAPRPGVGGDLACRTAAPAAGRRGRRRGWRPQTHTGSSGGQTQPRRSAVDEALDDAVLERVVAEDDQPAARPQQVQAAASARAARPARG